MLTIMKVTGALLLASALAFYAVAVYAMNSWEFRRRLPYKSPFELWGRGCFCFYAGAALIVIAEVTKHFE